HWPGAPISNLPAGRHTASQKIKPRYGVTTLAPQTFGVLLPKMQGMEVEQPTTENNQEMIEINIKEFLETAHYYLFGQAPNRQPALVLAPIRRVR
ncbi:MAG: hypothetical protein ACD_10C00544G0002, partial [uncultured bacterium]